MKTYSSSLRVISGRGRLALALMAALVVALLLGIGLPGGERALATGDGNIRGTATLVIGGSPLTCTVNGALDGGSVIDPGPPDVSFVTDALEGDGFCGANLKITMTGSITGTITEQQNQTTGVLDFPADGIFEVQLVLDIDGFGLVHNLVAEPMNIECLDIIEEDLFPCILAPSTSVDLWNVGETTIVATVTTVDIDFDGLNVGGVAELPEVEDTPLQVDDSSGTSTGMLAGMAAVAAAAVVLLGGGAWYARRNWLRRPR